MNLELWRRLMNLEFWRRVMNLELRPCVHSRLLSTLEDKATQPPAKRETL